MKNLFSVNKTYDREANDFDENRYLSAHVSEEVRGKMKSAFSAMEDEYAPREPTEEEKALKKQGRYYWILSVVCLLTGAALIFIDRRTKISESVPFLHFLHLPLLVGFVVFIFKIRRISRKQTKLGNDGLQLDFTEAAKRLEEAAAEAARELGVPEGALSVDILPFHYKIKGDYKTKDDIPVPIGKKNHFDNISVSMYTEGSDLCMATAQELFRIPLSDIRGYREYDEDFEIDMWLKPEEFNSEKYAEYGIRKSGFLARKAHGFYGLDIRGEFEVLVPCYDFSLVKRLLPQSSLLPLQDR